MATGRVIASSLSFTGEGARFYKYRHQNEKYLVRRLSMEVARRRIGFVCKLDTK